MKKEFINAAELTGFGAQAMALIASLERIEEWCCYASEEDTSARLMALQQIGVCARDALKTVSGGESTAYSSKERK